MGSQNLASYHTFRHLGKGGYGFRFANIDLEPIRAAEFGSEDRTQFATRPPAVRMNLLRFSSWVFGL